MNHIYLLVAFYTSHTKFCPHHVSHINTLTPSAVEVDDVLFHACELARLGYVCPVMFSV